MYFTKLGTLLDLLYLKQQSTGPYLELVVQFISPYFITLMNILILFFISPYVIILSYKFFRCFLWAWNLVFPTEGITKLRMLDNRVLGNISQPMMEDVSGAWRKLYSEELRDLY
jgi:hypothetical protein